MSKRQDEVHRNWSKDAKARGNRTITISAPTDSQTKLYAQGLDLAMEGIEEPLVLVLGMTPEPRNLALSKGCRVLATDFNFDMIINLQPNINSPADPRNMVMRVDWTELTRYLQPGIFDAAIGDGVLAQLDPSGIKTLLGNVAQLLRPGGIFSTRIDLYLPDYPVDTFTNYLEQYRAKRLSLIDLAIRVLMYSNLSDQLYDKQTHLCQTHKFWEVMDLKAREGVITPEENTYIQERKMNLTHYLLPKPLLYEEILGPLFEEVPLEQFDELWPTYTGRKKV